MHFLEREVHGRQLVFLPGLHPDAHFHPGLIAADSARSGFPCAQAGLDKSCPSRDFNILSGKSFNNRRQHERL